MKGIRKLPDRERPEHAYWSPEIRALSDSSRTHVTRRDRMICLTKHRYKFGDAFAEARKNLQHVYECPCCGTWHLSSKSTRSAQDGLDNRSGD